MGLWNMPKVRVGVLKIGCIGCTPLLEYLLDERADREDIEVRVVGSGAKMTDEDVEDVVKGMLNFNPSFVILTTPNATLPGPKKVVELLTNAKLPTLVISDAPAQKARKYLEEKGAGYIIVLADSMIGARREFLDPVEMAIYNSDVIRVLAITGVYNILYEAIDSIIEALKTGKELTLPRIVVNAETAVNKAGFGNPYAKAKAMAAFEIAATVSKLTTAACFKIKERERYIFYAAAAHEMMRYAASLADEAREIEKYGDHVVRRPHSKEGVILHKTRLLEKPLK
ncbi:MAG: F420-dependent methylenetetrahydromethanopterin dehydrogenase [Thermoprotei archaeon]|nr:MAG: F420-dependent methylenetetrahydromethanopterin dehydrogenase [Thermoprotei archaeon]RLF23754.1 MAG: F420-dependent methylenetetrahydromethanopterin dehydrogenase [Thermoprotei archaeon]